MVVSRRHLTGFRVQGVYGASSLSPATCGWTFAPAAATTRTKKEG